MMNDKLKTIMMKFSTTDLRAFLGENLIEQYQLEWSESKALTKGLLCDMILKLNGISILNNSDFRRKIISHMDRVDIEHLFSYVPISKRKGITDDYQKAEVIFNSPWKESELTFEFLNSLGIQEKFFNDDKVEYQSIEMADNQATFYELLDYQYVIKQRVLHILEQPYELKRMLVHMPTGTGKTKTMMHTITNYINFTLKKKGLVIWIAHTTELLDQAYTTFMNVWSHLGIGQINVYKFWSKYDLNVDITEYNGVMFCGISKLDSCRKNNKKLFDITGLWEYPHLCSKQCYL
ncbi:MAG: DEAD/DEAH box helicase family protein [Oscillospiraceae bacterium]|nr:DEAD/DEAH box helicase family protein [Oscillospiraceae bacterium]